MVRVDYLRHSTPLWQLSDPSYLQVEEYVQCSMELTHVTPLDIDNIFQTAGLTVAERLTEDPTVSVLVLEAGEDHVNDPEIRTYDHTLTTMPRESILITACSSSLHLGFSLFQEKIHMGLPNCMFLPFCLLEAIMRKPDYQILSIKRSPTNQGQVANMFGSGMRCLILN